MLKLREIIDNVLCEFTELSGEYLEAKKEDVLDRLCEELANERKERGK